MAGHEPGERRSSGGIWVDTDAPIPLPGRERRVLAAVGGAGLVVVLLLALGLVLIADRNESDTSAQTLPTASPSPTTTPSRTPAQQRTTGSARPTPGPLKGPAYAGGLSAVSPRKVHASCTDNPSSDAAGDPVDFEVTNIDDGDDGTAWRCPGDGDGERIVLRLVGAQKVAAVEIIPGYAKVDPVSGVDRYEQNRRLTKVRWRFDGDRFVVQRLDPDPGNRSPQRLRIPVVTTTKVTLEFLKSSSAERDNVAVSTVRISAPRG